MNPPVRAPGLPPHIQVIPDPRRTGARRAGAAHTSYECAGCGGVYHKFRCRDIPAKSAERFTWARRELERWQTESPPDASEWFWSVRTGGRVVGPRGRRSLLWCLHVYKLTMFMQEHIHCASAEPEPDFDVETWVQMLSLGS